jgi:signal transduction histidine kinase
VPTGRVVVAARPRGQREEDDVPRHLESERRRIAARLHDDSLQVMSATAMRLRLLRDELDRAEHLDELEQLEDTVARAIARLRELVSELRQPAQGS